MQTYQEFAAMFRGFGAELDARGLRQLLQATRDEKVPAGTVLFEEGVPQRQLVFVCDGKLEASVLVGGAQRKVGELGPGHLVGEVTLIVGGPATATIRAVTPAALLAISGEKFDELGRSNPAVAAGVLRAVCKSLSRRLVHATEQVSALTATVSPEQASGASSRDAAKPGMLSAFRNLLGMGE